MRLLVTGGAGFIGANFVRWVLRNQPDVQVTNLDALTYAGNEASLADLVDDPGYGHRYRFVRGDVTDPQAVEAAVAGQDAVVHFAAETHVDRSITDADAFLRTNVLGAYQVFEACRRAETPRVLHISTDEVYGSIAEPGAFAEDDPLQPSSPYSASKAAADLLARSFRVTHGCPITVTRTTNNYGPYQYPEKLIPLFVLSLLAGGTVPVYGDGRNVRDWTYVEDNVEAQWLVLTEGVPGEVYNVGAGEERSNLEVTRALLHQLGRDESAIEHVADRPGHDERYAVDARRVRELGWTPRRSFEEGLERTVAWYRDNEAWWGPLVERGATQRRGLTAGT